MKVDVSPYRITLTQLARLREPQLFILISALAWGTSACSWSTGKPARDADSQKSEEQGKEAGKSDDKKKSASKSKKGRAEDPSEEKVSSGDETKADQEEPSSKDSKETKEEQATATPQPKAPVKAPRPDMSGKAKKAFNAGKKAFAAGDLQGAKKQYSAAVKADSDAYEAYYALGVVQERLGNPKSARNNYKKALAVVPDYEEGIVAYAVSQAREGDPDGALSFLKKKQSEVGKSAAILAAMAEVNSIKGDSGKAQSLAQESLKLNPTYKPAMVALARDHYRSRRIELALYALKGILDGYGESNPPRDKDNAEARLIRGMIYAEQGLRGPAMEEMEKALAVRPDLVDAHLTLANFMMAAGNAKEARPHLEMAIRYDNKNVAAHLQLGDAYRLLNRPEDARRELEWVLAAEPNQGAAHYNLGLLFLLSDKMKGMTEEAMLDKALQHLEAYKARAERGGPDDVDDLITRAKTRKALLKAKQDAAAAGG